MALTNAEKQRRWQAKAAQSKRNFEGLEEDIEKIGDLLQELYYEEIPAKDDPEYYRTVVRSLRSRLESWSIRHKRKVV